MDKITAWLKARASEKSTYKGLGFIAVALGFHVSPDTAQTIVQFLAALIGFINVIRDEANG